MLAFDIGNIDPHGIYGRDVKEYKKLVEENLGEGKGNPIIKPDTKA